MSNPSITKIKPNPRGKDKTSSGYASEQQLAGEWVDITNTGANGVDLTGLDLYHKAYSSGGNFTWELVCSMPKWTLPARSTLRIHTGKGPLDVVRAEDKSGCDYHLFTGHDRYVWNNDQSDTPLLWYPSQKQAIDSATYDANPPEGVVLVRSGDKLVAGFASYLNV